MQNVENADEQLPDVEPSTQDTLAILKGKKARKAKAVSERPKAIILPVAGKAKMKTWHYGIMLSFVLMVVVPVAVVFWYLQVRAADQFTSTVGFSVRSEDSSSALDILGGLTSISSGGSSDTDILYEFIQSQQLVDVVDKRLDLRNIYSIPVNDPFFSFNSEGAIEDLVAYWSRMVKIYYNAPAQLIELRVLAFSAADAQAIAQEIFSQSSIMINDLSAIAQEDATRYSGVELDKAVARLKTARQAITEFRNREQIVDPNADIQGQMGLLNTLQQQLAATLIESDLLRGTTRPGDPRLDQAARKIKVIEERIAAERQKFGVGPGTEGQAFSTLVSTYEGLTVDREFAEQAYVSALATFDSAQAKALRQSRYLAAYIKPTLAETATYPRRPTIIAVLTLFLFLMWSIAILIAYAIKDRR